MFSGVERGERLSEEAKIDPMFSLTLLAIGNTMCGDNWI
jgi:hypothetical protein